jgi:hypothetical protein
VLLVIFLPIDLTSVFTVLNDYSRLGIFCKYITSLSLIFRVITVFTVFRLLTDFVCLYSVLMSFDFPFVRLF